MRTPAGERWRRELEAWRIPNDILSKAPESPWGFPVELFRAEARAGAEGSSARAALESLPGGGSVLDVGCGGGVASLALVPPATEIVGFDESDSMLAELDAAAQERGVVHSTIRGTWPGDAAAAPVTDVVVCHHVAYNVADLASFAAALGAHARRRVVMELTAVHPLVATAPLWKRFHDLDRPSGPDASLAREVLVEAGLPVKETRSVRATRQLPRDVLVAFTRRRLCLPIEREPEVDVALGDDAEFPGHEVVTLYWDTADPPDLAR